MIGDETGRIRVICITRLAAAALILAWAAQGQDKSSPEGLEFFEQKIRPALAKNCYACHSSASKVMMAGLSLESRESIRRGCANGPAILPGKPDESLLVKAIRHEGRQMPPAGKLPDSMIADFEKWIAMGAPDPREGGSGWVETKIDIEKGRQYWAFQAPKTPAKPIAAGSFGGQTPGAGPGRRPRHLAAARHLRSHRPAAHPGSD